MTWRRSAEGGQLEALIPSPRRSTGARAQSARTFLLVMFLLDGLGGICRAQATGPRVHQLGRTVATATEPFRITGLPRILSDGSVLINDGLGRRLLLLDSTLSHTTVLLDTIHNTEHWYPTRAGALLAYPGDSSAFCDGDAGAVLVIDSKGKIDRTMPAPGCVGFLTGRFDPAGRLVFQLGAAGSAVSVGVTCESCTPEERAFRVQAAAAAPDSLPILRARPAKTPTAINGAIVGVDTISRLRNAGVAAGVEPFVAANGAVVPRPIRRVFVLFDAWTMTSDGTIAVVRGHDYHIDWISPDGTRSSSSPLPFEWHRLSDSEKVAIVDSARADLEAHPLQVNAPYYHGPLAGDVEPPDSLPDYPPPFSLGGVLADAEGNVWIHTTPYHASAEAAGLVYDVVNRRGVVIDRVQIPGATTIVGFGHGVVYLSSRTGTGSSLVRVLLR